MLTRDHSAETSSSKTDACNYSCRIDSLLQHRTAFAYSFSICFLFTSFGIATTILCFVGDIRDLFVVSLD